MELPSSVWTSWISTSLDRPFRATYIQSIVSVTGAGDTLFGTLAMEMVKDDSWLNDMGDKKNAVVSRAMNNVVKTFQSKDAVCKSIL